MKKHTAIEWLEIQFDRYTSGGVNVPNNKIFKLTEKAKAMEKEQMNKCYNHGSFSLIDNGHGDIFEEYYEKTYPKKRW